MILYKRQPDGTIRRYFINQQGTSVVMQGAVNHIREEEDEDRAALFMQNKIKEKMRDGWCKSQDEAMGFVDSRVMLAKKCMPDKLEEWWSKNVTKKKIPYLLGEPKLNGLRSVLSDNGFISRLGNPFAKLYKKDFASLGTTFPFPLDGELYAHGYSLEEIIEMVKGSRDNKDLLFYVFDLIDTSGTSYIDRLLQVPLYKDLKIRAISGTPLQSYSEAATFFKKCEDAKYEGMVLRFPDDPYVCGSRTWSITKVKSPIDMEFIIVDFTRDTKGRIVFICITSEGKKFKVVPAWTHQERSHEDDIYTNYLGDLMTVKFYEWTRDNKPRHGTGVAIRNYE